MNYKRDVLLFAPASKHIYITEFCRSRGKIPKVAHPQIRNSYLLHFVTKGTAHFSDFEIHSGEAFLITKNVLHHFSFDANFDNYWIGFDGEGAQNLLNAFGFPSNEHIHFKCDNPEQIKNFLDIGFSALCENKNENDALSILLRCMSYIIPHTKSTLVSYVEQAKTFIDNNYNYNISMETVSQNVNISEKHLCKLFKKSLGISPQQYLIQVRMKNAKRLLINTNMLIKEIADNVGFSSQFAFATAYKKHFKITPSQERNTSKNKI